MRLHRPLSSWKHTILAALALVPVAGCHSRTDVQCGTEPALVDGKDVGLEACTNDVVHRAKAVTCESHLPRAAVCPGDHTGCTTDADCTEKPFGRCDDWGNSCTCTYGCQTDADCQLPGDPTPLVCLCGDVVGECELAECVTDADCPGSFCTVVHHPTAFVDSPDVACLSPDNECEIDADCGSGNFCTTDGNGRRVCPSGGGGIFDFGSGRPFLVEGAARRAALTSRADWRGGEAPDVSGLPPAERAAIAEGWAAAGLLEHASVAAFARFTLQLLALGATPDLIRDAQAAVADETEHARTCFALASAYAGRPLGPGPLALGGALAGSTPGEILATAILEGCIGETLAAVEAAELAERATDPVVRRALATISVDETRHAALAWRFVRWAIASDPALAAVAEETFAAAMGRASRGGEEQDGTDRTAYGIANEALRQAIARQALRAVVRPCAEALLGEARRQARVGLTLSA